jgi:hypothetical protein
MLSKPNVTIIIPYKKNLRYLFSALKSVFNQTYKNYVKLILFMTMKIRQIYTKLKNF